LALLHSPWVRQGHVKKLQFQHAHGYGLSVG